MLSARSLFLLLLSIAALLLGASFLTLGYQATWELWNIPVMSPYFADLRSITAGAESAALGFDPLQHNPADPWGRTMAYPRIWQGLFLLGIDQSDTLWIGLLFIALFVAGVVVLVRQVTLTPWAALLLLVALFSPAVLLGVERGNNDLLAFFLVALFLLLLPRRPWLALVPLFLAFLIKLFPLLAVAALLRLEPRQLRSLLLPTALLALLYFGISLGDLLLIQQHTLSGTFYAWGLGVYPLFLQQQGLASQGRLLLLTGYLLLPLLLGLGWWLNRRLPLELPEQQSHALDALRAGLAIYAGSYLLFINWDYRLLFLLLAIPQLTLWAGSSHLLLRWLARAALVALLASLWSAITLRYLGTLWPDAAAYLRVDELLNGLLFALALLLLTLSLPTWLKGLLRCTPQPSASEDPANQRLLLTRLAVVALLAVTALHHIKSNEPFYNWDLIPYVAIAHGSDDPALRQQQTLRSIEQQVPAQHHAILLAGNDYRQQVASDPEVLTQQLPFYRVKPLYPALLGVLQRAGIDPVPASLWLSRAAYLAVALLLAAWLLRLFPPLAALALGLLLLTQPWLINLARYSTPDALALLLLLAGMLLLLERRHPSGWLLLLVAVAARPDTVILLALIGGWAIYHRLPHWRWAATAVVAGAALYLLQGALAGSYSWRVLFHHSLVASLTHPAHFVPQLTTANYIEYYTLLLRPDQVSAVLLFALLLTLASAVLWRSLAPAGAGVPAGADASPTASRVTLWEGALWSSALYVVIHWLVHPVEKERTLAFILLFALLGLLALLRRRSESWLPADPLPFGRWYNALLDHSQYLRYTAPLAALERHRWGLFAVAATLALASTLLALLPLLLQSGWPNNHEDLNWIPRILTIAQAFAHGDLFPIWDADAIHGTGHATPLLYHKLFNVVAAVGYLLSGSEKSAALLAIALFSLVGIAGLYAALRTLGWRPLAALLPALAFPHMNYAVTDYLVRGAFAEYAALALIPWIIWWCIDLLTHQRFRLIIAPLLFLTLLAHTVMAYYAVGLLLITFVVHWMHRSAAWWRELLRPTLAVLLFFALSAPLIGLILLFSHYFFMDFYLIYLPTEHFRYPLEYLFDIGHRWGDPPERFTIQLDLAYTLLLLTALLGYRYLRSAAFTPTQQRLATALGGGLLLYGLLQLPIAAPFYLHLPGAAYLQFPWRLVAFLSLLTLLLAALLLRTLPRRPATLLLALAALLVIAVNVTRPAPSQWFPLDSPEQIAQQQHTPHEYLPRPPVSEPLRPSDPHLHNTLKEMGSALSQRVTWNLHSGSHSIIPGCGVTPLTSADYLERQLAITCHTPHEVVTPHVYTRFTQVLRLTPEGEERLEGYRSGDDYRLRFALPAGEQQVVIRFPTLGRILGSRL